MAGSPSIHPMPSRNALPLAALLLASVLGQACHSTGAAPARETVALPPPPAPLARPQPAPAPWAAAPAAPSTAERRAAAQAALDLLSKHLQAGKLDYRFNRSAETMVVATAGLAFLCAGSTLDGGPYRTALQACFDQVVKYKDFRMQPVWGAGQGAIFLAELHRLGAGRQKAKVRAELERYAGLLVKSQTVRGGWCHTFEDVPNPLKYTDLMATSVLALQGLGMAKREGVAVPQTTLDLGLKYIKTCSDEAEGHIGYSPRQGQQGWGAPGRNAGGVLALRAMGQNDLTLTKNAIRFVKDNYPVTKPGNISQDLNSGHASAQLGQMWAAWMAAETDSYPAFWAAQGGHIMGRRLADGAFKPAPTDGKPVSADDDAEGGDMATAMHALMLALPEGRLTTAKPDARASAGDAERAILAAARLAADTLGDATPPTLRKLAAYTEGKDPKAMAREIRDLLQAAAKEVAAADLPAERKGATLAALLTGGASATFAHKAAQQRAEIRLTVEPPVMPGLGCVAKPLYPPDCTLEPKLGQKTVPVSATRQAAVVFSEACRSQPPTEAAAVLLVWTWGKVVFEQRIDAPAAPGTK